MYKNTQILTPGGYVKVSSLKKGDLITTSDNRNIPIKNIYNTNLEACTEQFPLIIPKDAFCENYPPNECKLNSNTLVKFNEKWIYLDDFKFKKDDYMIIIQTYYIELENYKTDNLVINGGLIIESDKGRDFEMHKEYQNRMKRLTNKYDLMTEKLN